MTKMNTKSTDCKKLSKKLRVLSTKEFLILPQTSLNYTETTSEIM